MEGNHQLYATYRLPLNYWQCDCQSQCGQGGGENYETVKSNLVSSQNVA